MVELQVYVDESAPGEPGRWDVFTLGGVGIDHSKVSRFDREWKRALRFAPVPLERFHTTDWENSWQEYRGWSEEERLRLFHQLCAVISRSVTFAVSCSIDLRGYKELTLHQRGVIGSSRYGICFQSCHARVRAWQLAQERDAPVDYVLDQTPPLGAAGEIPELVRLFWAAEISSISFADARIFPGLQAADIIAYEMAKQAAHELGRAAQPHQRRSIQALLYKAPQLNDGHGFLDGAGMRDISIRVQQGEGILPTKKVRVPLNLKHLQ